MEQTARRQVIDKAEEHWKAGHLLEAGRLVFEHIPIEYRPLWAANLLETVCVHTIPSQEIETVLEFARNPQNWNESRWREAHGVVDAVNELHYQIQEPLPNSVFTLAKDAAKVIYTSRPFPAPFDYDAGWKIAEDLKQVINLVNDAEFTTRAWSTLCDEQYIQLESSRLCHPSCPVCSARGLALEEKPFVW